jgi:hypothetical protein
MLVAMAVIMLVAMVAITEEAMVVAMAVIMLVAMVAILNLMLLTVINPLELKVGKIEVMVTLLIPLIMKAAVVGEKEVFQMKLMYQMKRTSNPFL